MEKTLIITNLGGPLTRRNTGEINSGLAKFETSWGYDPYSKPGNLTWMEQPTSILSLGGANSAIVAMKNRPTSSGNTRSNVFAVANSLSLYEIKVDNGSNPNFDSASIISTLPVNPNFVRSADMLFYGSTEKIFMSGDNAIIKSNFDGSGIASIHGVSSLLASTPHPMTNFLGKIYFGNGNNIGEIDSTELMTTGAKLNPALPAGFYVKDLDVTPDGNYLQMTVSRSESTIVVDGGQNLGAPAAGESTKAYWNGIDAGITSSERYDGISLVSSNVFGEKNYVFGFDVNGAVLLSGTQKVLSLPKNAAPNPKSTFSFSNMLAFANLEYDTSDTKMKGVVYNYGKFDYEIPEGLYRLLKYTSLSRDVVAIPASINVSNLVYTPNIFSTANNQMGVSKMYFSTVESSVSGDSNRDGKLQKFSLAPTGTGSVVAGVYETQNQLFSKKVKLGEVRFYTEPFVANNAFTLAVLNSGSSIIAQNTYTVGTNVTAGDDLIRFKPEIAPIQAVGFKITNSGSANWTGLKLEADYSDGGT